ncbi:MAG: hypothetical protein CFE32_13825 [Alphaproteobacteria bacterium PA3]|nr:MAG: hypothetical protein CFE32_13825 [Alphaproteobacteria bacterium PA3]
MASASEPASQSGTDRCEISIENLGPGSDFIGCEVIGYRGQLLIDPAQTIGAILATAKPRVFKLTSSGGRSDGAIVLEAVLRRNKIRLLIEDYCVSACAHFLALSSSISEVGPDALVAFHHTWTSMDAMVSRDPDPRVRSFFVRIAKLEQSAYRRQGMDTRMLLMPHLQLGLKCYEPIFEGTQLVDVRYYSNYTLWSAADVSVVGARWWPEGFRTRSINQTLENVIRVIVPEERPKVFVQTSAILPREWTYQRFAATLAETKRCS